MRLPMLYRRVGEEEWNRGTTENISASGVLFVGGRDLETAAPVEMTVTLPPEVSGTAAVEVICLGQVVRRAPAPRTGGVELAATIREHRLARRE
ncbi:MAG: hypothetical protein HYY76_07935 [Acidobacteria bacterium]|nr:hypothetical protein [Acidobacteriota bacterium]